MIKFNNRLTLTIFLSLFSTMILLVSPLTRAQQLNQVRAYMAPTEPQKSFFPSEQQVQEALASGMFKAEQASLFSPLELEQEPQDFINQFSTPDAKRVVPQFVALDLRMNNRAMPQKYKQPNGNGYPQQKIKSSVMFRPENNNFLPQEFDHTVMGEFPPSSIELLYKNNPFSFPDSLPAVRLANTNGLNPMENGFPLLPKTMPLNRKKAWGNKHIDSSGFYTNFTNKGWNKPIKTPHNLGRIGERRSFPSAKIADSMLVSDAVIHQFPPLIEEVKYRSNASKWNVFDRD